MTKEEIVARLENVALTIGKLRNPDILGVSITEFDITTVQLYVGEKQPSEVLQGIEGEMKKEREVGDGYDKYMIVDVNGVEVCCLKENAAPEAGTSEAAKCEVDCPSDVIVSINSDAGFVKEAL